MDNDKIITHGIESLKVAPEIQRDVKEFVSQVVGFYKSNLVSIVAFGSAVTGDYDRAASDVNLMVVYVDMEIGELDRVASLSRHWLKKRRIAPRFLSRRNLEESFDYFQVDYLSMRDAHLVLCGEDLFAGVEARKAALRWQVAYEVKAMRMRIKQQFWRSEGEARFMRSVLGDRFTSLVHLMRALLLLCDLPAPVMHREIIDAAVTHFKVDPAAATRLLGLRRGEPANAASLRKMFEELLDMIRVIDARVEEVKL